ncbi:MAG TPA: phosphate uptake regulator PhoU [Synechococcales bacterium UBA12195]|jgi:phosphate transport system protein|nr:phosphate uptake regulator PhoU [Cyanobacteriota bacterium]NBQ36924.1 phosphate uptake regulator PhoU [Synechococcus sp.]CAK28478.1 Phosphate uptake regulator [Synechococcus sp. RCC307]HCV56530.1 phosphate uptake regulator PhoU [Synechococcales bacterium UBA12195]|tara:strand:+ start:2589 stop:3245 length:657 start_codon:yes stop_codon:yes gene_type:complete
MLLSAWRNQVPARSGADAVGALKQELLRLGSMVEESAVLARAVLSGPDMEAAPQIRRGDDRIDKLYRRLEEECADLLCHKRLSQTQVREVLSYMHCLRDLERFGDYCKELATLGEQLLPAQPVMLRDEVLTMLDRCRSLLALALNSLSEEDLSAGARLQALDDLVDRDYERLVEELTQTCTSSEFRDHQLMLVLVLRCIERMADHAVNVSQRVARRER